MRRSIRLRSRGGRRGCNVTDFRRSCSGIGSGGGVPVHVSHCGAAELVGDGFENFAGGRVFDSAYGAADVDRIADSYTDLISDVDDDDVSADVGHQSGIVGFNDRQGSRGSIELRSAIVDRFAYGLAKDCLGEVAAAHVEGAAATAVTGAAPSAEHQAGARRFAVAGDGSEDFASGGVHESSRDGHYGFGFFFAHAGNCARPAAMSAAYAADLLVVAAKLRDGAEDDGVDAKDAADFGRAGGIGAVAIVKVLF